MREPTVTPHVLTASAFLGVPGFHMEAPGEGTAGGVAAPADPGAGAPDPGVTPPAADPAAAAPAADPAAALTPDMIEQFISTGTDMTAILREAAQLAQGPYAPPAPQAAPAEPEVDPVQAALADFDPFNPQSIQGVLAAQAEQLKGQFQQELEQRLGPLAEIVNDVATERGEAAAKAELEGFQAHIQFPIDHDAAIAEARSMLIAADAMGQQIDERTALWQAANRIAQRDQQVSEQAVAAYRARLAEHAQAGGDPAAGAAAGGAETPPLPTGPGKYAEQVRRSMALRRSAPAQL